MRVTFITPAVPDREQVRNMLAVVGVRVSAEVIDRLTKYELIMAYDYAAREHLSASDNPVQRRGKPYFLTLIEQSS